jgi:crotonobetainyl-CoA:carnitine CoA-transferase CaiB-like acyl-CoA transferase
VRNREECDTLVANYSVRFSSEELTQKLTKAGVPAAEIKTPREVIEHPQLKARNRWREVGTEFSRIPALLPPVTFADVEARMGDVPALGQQTTALLLEAGVDASTIEEMLSSGLAVQSGALER